MRGFDLRRKILKRIGAVRVRTADSEALPSQNTTGCARRRRVRRKVKLDRVVTLHCCDSESSRLLREVALGTTARIHWIRAVIGGFLAEAWLIAVVISVFEIFGQHALLHVVPPAALVTCFLFALWVGRGLLHSVAVGRTLSAGPEPIKEIPAKSRST
jgi:hypothetical protein